MYIPGSFAETDPAKLHEFMRQYSFATLISRGPEGLVASHLPLLFNPDPAPKGHLIGHMARANSQWRDVQGEALAIFPGPHAYVSPAWYEEDGTVPTWNYVAVHAYGNFQVVEDREGLLGILRRSVQTFENPRPNPWAFDESAAHVDKLLRTIVGFRVELTRVEGKWKLNQNHSEERRRKVVRALDQQPDDDSQAIASLMREQLG
ncbi:MAG TPA: FMN-binding negative transcriptional regulator [Isosphaeraceae bacterium]|jgi:transcriptional regulator|nr:FMN-binding negative transcriptional regulator [Isosphaeraceae bacterium]